MKYLGLILCIVAVGAMGAASDYRVIGKIAIGGAGRWDYIYLDKDAHRLYVAHGGQTDVVDTSSSRVIGSIPGTNGVHGVAIAGDLGLGFTSNGADNAVSVFDLATLKVKSKLKTGANPDAIVYDPSSHRVVTLNGRSKDATLIDAKSGAIIAASIPVGGKPEFAQVDERGLVYFNVEDRNEIAVLDPHSGVVTGRYSISPCESPTGLAMDAQHRLYSVCGNGLMVVSDPGTGKVLGQSPIGAGPDGVALLDGLAFSANGSDGTLSIVGESSPEHFATLATVDVARGARTIAADPASHRLYLPAADFLPGPLPPDAEGPPSRPKPIPDTFRIIIVGT